MSMGPEFARPEIGFKAEDNQHLLDYFNTTDRAPLDPKGQRAPTVQERIDSSLKDFERLINRQPTTEEKRRIEEIQLKCSGWLEGLKIDLEGKTHIPLEYFNRLVAEHEQMIEFVARDRLNFDATYTKSSIVRDDKIARLEGDLDNNNKLENCNETNAPLAPSSEVADENIRLRAQLEKLDAKNQWLKDEIDELSKILQSSDMGAGVNYNHTERIQAKLVDDDHPLIAKLEQLKEEAENYRKMKFENFRLEEQVRGISTPQLQLEEESLREKTSRQMEGKNMQIIQLQTRLEQLEKDKVRTTAEYKSRIADLLEKFQNLDGKYNQKVMELEVSKTTNNDLQESLREVEGKFAEDAEREHSGRQAEIEQLNYTPKNSNYNIDEQQQYLADKEDNWSRKLHEEYLLKKKALEAEFHTKTEDFKNGIMQKTAELDMAIAKNQASATEFQQRKEQADEELKEMSNKIVTLQKQLHEYGQNDSAANAEASKFSDTLSYRQNQNRFARKHRQAIINLKETIIVLLTTVKDLIECADHGYIIHTKHLLALVTEISEKFFAGEEINEAVMKLKVFQYLDHRDMLTTSPRTPHRESPCLSCEGYAKDQMDILIELQDCLTESISRVEEVCD